MVCQRCGAEIVEGHVFCDKCGAEIQVVPDFNLFEEEVLPSIVINEQDVRQTHKDNYDSEKDIINYLLTHPTHVMIVIILICACVGAYMYSGSYSRAIHRGERALARGEYEQALTYYLSAVDRQGTVDGYVHLGDGYKKLNEFDKAEDAYYEALKLTGDSVSDQARVYSLLLELYSEKGDRDAIEKLYGFIDDDKVVEALNADYVRPPVFSKDEGDYDDDIRIKISSPDSFDIYYTTDGTDPSPSNGSIYREPLNAGGGVTTIKACCVDPEGRWGFVAEKTYNITYRIPEMPSASPSSGTYHAPVKVTLTSEEGNIYYTWDGKVPTENSKLYTGPIEIPEGNNVLSAIVINEHEMASPILRCNYVYMP